MRTTPKTTAGSSDLSTGGTPTLEPLVQQYVAPGSTVWSDEWRAYSGLANLPQNYNHQTVNHSQNFRDPATGACTNHVEAMWSRCKKQTSKAGNREQAPLVVDEFVLRERMDNRGPAMWRAFLPPGPYGLLAPLIQTALFRAKKYPNGPFKDQQS